MKSSEEYSKWLRARRAILFAAFLAYVGASVGIPLAKASNVSCANGFFWEDCAHTRFLRFCPGWRCRRADPFTSFVARVCRCSMKVESFTPPASVLLHSCSPTCPLQGLLFVFCAVLILRDRTTPLQRSIAEPQRCISGCVGVDPPSCWMQVFQAWALEPRIFTLASRVY